MKQISYLPLVVLFFGVLVAGCASKSELETAQGDLQICLEEKLRAQATVVTWERRFDQESERWESVEASLTDALPKAFSEFHEERDRIVQMVPEQVRDEVDNYLQDYFHTVMSGFENLADDNQEIRLKLDTYAEVLKTLQAGNQQIAGSIDGALADERAKRTVERRKREELSTDLSQIVAELTQFDSTVINCKNCDERLRLSRKERETITGFHQDVIRRLAEIQTFASDAAPADGWEDGGE